MTYEEIKELYQDLENIQKEHDEQKRVKANILMEFNNAIWSFENFWDIYGEACFKIRYFSRKYVPKGTEVEEARAKLVTRLHQMIKELENDIERCWQTKE